MERAFKKFCIFGTILCGVTSSAGVTRNDPAIPKNPISVLMYRPNPANVATSSGLIPRSSTLGRVEHRAPDEVAEDTVPDVQH